MIAANCSAGRAHGTAVTSAHREELIAKTHAADVRFQLNDITNKACPGDPDFVWGSHDRANELRAGRATNAPALRPAIATDTLRQA
jgi:hypothetical protein